MLNARKLTGTDSALALLNARRLPARLNATEAAVLLGFNEHDITPLVAAGLIKPLGAPASNSPKYFSSGVVESLAKDERWLDRATHALAKYWSGKYSRKALTRPNGKSRAQDA